MSGPFGPDIFLLFIGLLCYNVIINTIYRLRTEAHMKKATEPVVKAPKPQTYKFTKAMWKEIATCPVCGVLLEKGEPYRIGWTKKTDYGGFLSIRGHRHCWERYYGW